jgi:hypothetical protein
MYDLISILPKAFWVARSATQGSDWNEREAIAYRSLLAQCPTKFNSEFSQRDIFLGGDMLRPYLLAQYSDEIQIVSAEQQALSIPQLISEIDSGKFGLVQKNMAGDDQMTCSMRILEKSRAFAERLRIPNVYLTSLTNASRYQSRRYPLNIGRLAQWLRFQHAGRVRAADLALDFDGNIESLVKDIISFCPDILGISVNFGELESLQLLIAGIRLVGIHPIICLGNILAAWDSDAAKEVCAGFQCFVSRSYGEIDLETVCRSFAQSTRLMKKPTTSNEDSVHKNINISPRTIVFPDERLLGETLRQHGQASIETSFGCQYGRCTFCPRDHRGIGWYRSKPQDAIAVIENMASFITAKNGNSFGVLSIVDEDAFGQEGRDRNVGEPPIVTLVNTAGSHKVRCEIYTRLEQIFDRRWEMSPSVERLKQLLQMRSALTRVFVGVESGSNSQLHRYGKGQTIRDIVAALRAGSMLRLPLEFGFITFDPFLTQQELVESLEFLSRTDVLSPVDVNLSPEDIYSFVTREEASAWPRSEPIFSRVAYMATELELFANSPFLKMLQNTSPRLIGKYDSAFTRFGYSYQDHAVGEIANWCRVWTEGTFKPIYKMRLAARTLNFKQNPYGEIINRYRKATFALLVSLTSRFCVDFRERLAPLSMWDVNNLIIEAAGRGDWLGKMGALWHWVAADEDNLSAMECVQFKSEKLSRRREA